MTSYFRLYVQRISDKTTTQIKSDDLDVISKIKDDFGLTKSTESIMCPQHTYEFLAGPKYIGLLISLTAIVQSY